MTVTVHRPARRVARTAAVALVPVLALVLAACSSEEQPPPDDAARALAEGLATGDLTGVRFTASTAATVQEQRETVLEPLAEVPLEVALTSVVTDEPEGGEDVDRATATLTYTWRVTEDESWEYETTARLALLEPEDGEDGPSSWAVAWEPDVLVPGLDDGDRLRVQRLRPERAEILGSGDRPLVTERPVYRIGVDKTKVASSRWDDVARTLADVTGIDAGAYAERVAAAGEKAFVEAITVRQADTAGVDVEAARAIGGVSVIEGVLPLAPTRDFARPILGRVGDATAEIIEESDGAVVAGDTVGLSGLQRQYDDQLRGVPGTIIEVVPGEDAEGEAADPREVFRVEAVDGEPLRTTLVEEMQVHAEEVLADTDVPSAIVAIRPSTGEVLAAASGTAGEGLSTATTGRYAPGSTFKVATTLAMLRDGLDPDSVVPCTPTLTVEGRTFQNVPGYPESAVGDVPLRTAFANSCNTAMISQRDAVSQQDLQDAAAALGLGVEAALGAPGFFGSVPADGGGTDHAASMIGQGRIEASPLAMATVAASVVAGERVSPTMVLPAESTGGADGDEEAAGADDTEGGEEAAGADDGAEQAPPAGGVTADDAATLHSLMRSVVTDGSGSVLQGLPGQVGAKTGTAQYGDGSQSHAWMIAFQDDLAVAVFLETGEGGAVTAGPLVRAFLEGPR